MDLGKGFLRGIHGLFIDVNASGSKRINMHHAQFQIPIAVPQQATLTKVQVSPEDETQPSDWQWGAW